MASEKRVAVGSPPPPGPPTPLLGQGWQVMSTDGTLAVDLYRQLRDKGFPGLLHSSPVDNQVRVIAGPYFDQQSLNQAKTALETAGFRIMRLW